MIEYDPCSEALYDDPFPFYKQLRDEAPVFKHPDYLPWFLSRFDDITKAILDLKSFTVTEGTTSMNILQAPDPDAANRFADNSDFEMEIGAVAMLDPPVHTRVRTSMNAPFKPAAAAALEPLARSIVRKRLDIARETGRMDAVAELAGYLSVRIACTILGLSLEDADQYTQWVNSIFERERGLFGMTERGRDASIALHAHLFQLVHECRTNGTQLEGLGNHILYGDFEGRKLNDLEAAFHFSMVLIGGTETLPKAASGAIWRLWEHPDQRAQVAADPALVPQAFHEALRFDMPTQMLGRTATREVEFHGQTIQPGEHVMFLWASANRDERKFEHADQFDIHRGFPRILSFGLGAHMCLGAHVARMEGKVILEELLAAFPEYEIIEDECVRMRSEFFRGLTSVPIIVGQN